MLLALSALACASSCRSSRDADRESGPPVGLSLEDVAHVPASAATTFEDLGAVTGFEKLSPEGRTAVMARANRSACSCGCPGHTVAQCLHQKETCDIAAQLAQRFVDDQLAVELQFAPAPHEEAVTGEKPAAPAAETTTPAAAAAAETTTAPAAPAAETTSPAAAPAAETTPSPAGSAPAAAPPSESPSSSPPQQGKQ